MTTKEAVEKLKQRGYVLSDDTEKLFPTKDCVSEIFFHEDYATITCPHKGRESVVDILHIYKDGHSSYSFCMGWG